MKRLLCVVVFLAGAVASRVLMPAQVAIPRLPLTALTRLLQPTLEAAYVPAAIKSITAISLTGSTTQTVSVTAANAILVFGGMQMTGAPAAMGRATITNGTTITSVVNTASSSKWVGALLEFYGTYVTGQGCTTATVPGDSVSLTGTATISSVSTTRTLLAYTGYSTADSNNANFGSTQATIVQTNATTLTATVNVADSSSRVVGVCYLVFK